MNAVLPTIAVRLDCLRDDVVKAHVSPASVGEDVVDLRQGNKATLNGAGGMFEVWRVAEGLRGDGLYRCESVLHPMVQLVDEKVPVLHRRPQLVYHPQTPNGRAPLQ